MLSISAHEAMMMKLSALIAVALALAPASLFRTFMDDPVAPCVLGAVIGEFARSAVQKEPATDRIVKRLFGSAGAVIVGFNVGWFGHGLPEHYIDGLEPGFSRLACAIVGWSFVKWLVTLDFGKMFGALGNKIVETIVNIAKNGRGG